MEKITYSIEKNDKYTNTKNYTNNTCAKIMSYTKNMMKYVIRCTNCGTEMISSQWRSWEWNDKKENW